MTAAALLAALQREPDSVPLRLRLARAQRAAGDAWTAAAWLSDAMRVAPRAVEPVQELADLLLVQQQFAQAAPLYQRLLDEHGARQAANLLHAGFCREHLDDIDAAADLYCAALAADPALVEAHVDLSGVLWRQEDLEGALAHARRAVELAPRHPYAQRILGTALLHVGRLQEAERHLRRALELQPGFMLAELDLAFTLLQSGQLAQGWRQYELRWRDGARVPRPGFFQPQAEWAGPQQPLAGKAIGVYAEQGLGDVIQFARYLPRLQALGAQVRCVVQPELAPLIEASFPGVECVLPGRSFNVHLHAALMDLAGRFGTDTPQAIPSQVPYLRPTPAALARWRERLAPWQGRMRIGLAWSGSLAQVNNRNRAMPLSTLAPLLRLPGVQVFSLQKGDPGPYADHVPGPGELVDLTGEWKDFDDSAAMLAQLDLVVTVDTAIAHLAGALGRPVWILLAPNADWRWLAGRDDSPWYPTARLFRRAVGEPRTAQVQRLLEAWRECPQPGYR